MVLFSLIRIFASNMKKILLMTLAVVLFGTVCQAKMKGADDQTKPRTECEMGKHERGGQEVVRLWYLLRLG